MLRPVFGLIVWIAVLGSSLPWLCGQRSVGRFDAALLSEDLSFDINEIPLSQQFQTQNDLNFASNVVFSPDSSRAFVSITASDKVAVFDGRSGEVIELIDTCRNPTELVLTPDGRKLIVPCIFVLENLPKENSSTGDQVGGIAIIDVDTLQVQIIELKKVVFSFLNNIVVTTDGSRGFIASSATDELLQIDLASGAEAGRLAFERGTRPSTITLSQDGTFFGVVLVGSGDLPQAEVPDSVRIVDSQTFQVTRNLAFTTPAGERPFSFSGLNRVVFSPDGRFALVADNGVPSFSRALFIDVENEQLVDVVENEDGLDVLQLGFGLANGAYTTPDGEHFVVLRDSSICTVKIETQKFRCTPTFPFEFFAMTNPAFTEDLMLVGSPLDDALLAFDWRTGSVVSALVVGGSVERMVEGAPVMVPSGPVSVTISPDGKTIATTYFNANSVELFEPISRFIVPELTAENVDQIQNANPLEDSDPIPLGERFFTGVAVTNSGERPAKVELTARGEFTDPPLREDVRILRATPNPIPVCDGGLGETTLQWFAGDRFETLEVRRNSVNGSVVGTGGFSDSAEVDGVEDGTFFFLLDSVSGELVDTLRVDLIESGCAPPAIILSPNPVPICPGERGHANILWETTGVATAVEVRLGAMDGTLVSTGGAIGNVPTGRWLTDGLTFFLLDAESGELLDTTVARLSEANCLLSLDRVLNLNEQLSFATDFLQPAPGRNFRGWVGLETDEVTLAGTFLSYDGELNRMDAGPLLPTLEHLAVLPEVRISDDFSTQIEVINPGPVRAEFQFDLFNSSGQFVAATVRAFAPSSRESFSVLGDPSLGEEDDGLFLFAGLEGESLIAADPSAVTICDGGFGQTTIRWDATGIAEEVEIRVGSTDGNILTRSGATGSVETGDWVRDRLIFYLLDAASGDVLDSVIVRTTEIGCPLPVISVFPNPITVCEGALGQALIAWDATDVAEQVAVRVGSLQGSTLVAGGPKGQMQTGQWVRDGLTFHLVNSDTGAELDSTTARLTGEGCVLSELEDAYIRVSGPGLVVFERVTDARRMAIIPAQPMGQSHTHFTIPQFMVFGGSDTVLKLVNPSTQPIGRLTDAGSRGELGPMLVSVALRGDDGGSIGVPVMLELENGASLRSRLVDLFELADEGLLQSGWIDVTGSRPGLVGAAEIQTSAGEALGSIPLQPVQEGNRISPYLAQGAGFVTSLAIVNPTEQGLEITLELTGPAGEVAATLGPLALGPGSRLVGTLPELFPEAGDVLGGTLVVRADGAVAGVELLQTDDSRTLSIVPFQRIE